MIAIHLTRPAIQIPDRKGLGIASYKDASKGAYIIKDYVNEKNRKGLIIVRGTSPTNSIIKILPRLINEGVNVKIVAAISWELFKIQSKDYKDYIAKVSEWHDAMIITNGSIKLMDRWIANQIVEKYSMSPDFDNKWRTGGSVDE